jgi:hypothetical protein
MPRRLGLGRRRIGLGVQFRLGGLLDLVGIAEELQQLEVRRRFRRRRNGGKPMRLCDCPMCMPRGEVKARRYRERVRERMREAGY